MEKIWGYVVGATIFGSVTGFIVLLIKSLLKNKINKRYAYLLWMILVIKLIIPFGPESNISLFNKIPINYNSQKILNSDATKLDNIDSNHVSREDTNNEVNSTTSTYQDNNSVNENNENFTKESQIVNKKPSISTTSVKLDKLSKILFFVWLSGFVFSLVTYMIIYISFTKDLKKCSRFKYERIEKILKDCKHKLNINKNIQVIVYDKISSPSLVGMINIKIILPRNLINLSEEELRHIFLHELCHYKNKDNYMDNLIGVLQCIHWFNPLIHYYFKKMRNDMEICCDERVLNLLNEDEHNKYGITMLNVLEKINFNHKMRVGLNMANDKKTIKERINLIKNNKNFSKNRKLFTLTGIICLLVMSGVLLTNGKSTDYGKEKLPVKANEILGKYPDYIGTREVIENKKRYLYETDYSEKSKVLYLTKTDKNNEIVEELSYEIDNNKIKKLDSDKYVSYKKYSGKDFMYIQEADVTFTINEIKIVNNEAKLYVIVKNESDKDLHISMDSITIGENKKSMDMEVTIGKEESQDNILTIKSISKISDLNDKHTGTILIRGMNNEDDVQKIDFINKF